MATEGKPLREHPGHRAVILLCPPTVNEFTDPFRKRYDPEWFERVPPHISILGPFETREPDGELALKLGWAVAGMAPFILKLGPPSTFLAPELVLFLSVRNEAPLHELHARVLGVLPAHTPALPFRPHLTVGRFASEAALAGALKELKEAYDAIAAQDDSVFEFQVREVHLYAERPETGVYRSISTVAMGTSDPGQ